MLICQEKREGFEYQIRIQKGGPIPNPALYIFKVGSVHIYAYPTLKHASATLGKSKILMSQVSGRLAKYARKIRGIKLTKICGKVFIVIGILFSSSGMTCRNARRAACAILPTMLLAMAGQKNKNNNREEGGRLGNRESLLAPDVSSHFICCRRVV